MFDDLTDEELIAAWVQLNDWRWPESLGPPPDGWSLEDAEANRPSVRATMAQIELRIDRAVLSTAYHSSHTPTDVRT